MKGTTPHPTAATTVNLGIGWSGCASGSGCTAVSRTPGGVTIGTASKCRRDPLDDIGSSPGTPQARRLSEIAALALAGDMRWRWLDRCVRGSCWWRLRSACSPATTGRGPLALNMSRSCRDRAGGCDATARSAVVRHVIVRALAALMNAFLTTLDESPLVAAYFLLVPAYTVAAWQTLRDAAARARIAGRGRGGQRLIARSAVGQFAERRSR